MIYPLMKLPICKLAGRLSIVLLPVFAAGLAAGQAPATAPAATQPADRWTIALTDRLSVKLLGASVFPPDDNTWHDADGLGLKAIPDDGEGYAFMRPDFDRSLADAKETSRLYDLVFQIQPWSPEIGLTLNDNGGLQAWGPVHDSKGPLPGRFSAILTIPRKEKQTDLHVGVAAGPWTTMVRSTSPRQSTSRSFRQLDQDVTVCLASLHASADKASVDVGYLFDQLPAARQSCDIRLMALVKGQWVAGAPADTRAADEHLWQSYKFDVPPQDITALEYQLRPYQWLMFTNVSLRRVFVGP